MLPSERPRLDVTPSGLDQFLNALSTAGVLATIALLVSVWDKLPAHVPTHFSMSGVPNQWGSRNSLLIFALVPLVMHIGLTILARMPWAYNYPVKLTEENVERLYALGRGMVIWLRTEVVWLFVILSWQTIQVALGHSHGMGPTFVFAPLVVIYGTVIYYIVMMFRARQSLAP